MTPFVILSQQTKNLLPAQNKILRFSQDDRPLVEVWLIKPLHITTRNPQFPQSQINTTDISFVSIDEMHDYVKEKASQRLNLRFWRFNLDLASGLPRPGLGIKRMESFFILKRDYLLVEDINILAFQNLLKILIVNKVFANSYIFVHILNSYSTYKYFSLDYC